MRSKNYHHITVGIVKESEMCLIHRVFTDIFKLRMRRADLGRNRVPCIKNLIR